MSRKKQGARPPRGEKAQPAPPPPLWKRAWSALRGHAKAVILFVGFGGFVTMMQWVRGDEKPFLDALAKAQTKLEDPAATEVARINAAKELLQLPGDPDQARRVADVLQVFLEAHTRPASPADPGAHLSCRDAAGSAPPYISHTLLALGIVKEKAGDGDPIQLPRAELRGVQADSARLDGASLRGACLVGARLNGARLAGADLTGAIMDGALLEGATLDSVRLEDASLVSAGLNEARLVHARLTRSDLRHASLVNADLTLALLAGAALDSADVSGASLACAYLRGVHLHGVSNWVEVRDFDGAYLFEAEGIPDAMLQFATRRGAIASELTQREWQKKRHECEVRTKPAGGPPVRR